MQLDVWPFAFAHHMALVPLAWLALRRERRALWWWIAGAFAISWLADTAAHFGDPLLFGTVYPVGQAGLIALVLAKRIEALALIGLLMVAGIVAVLWEGVSGPDLFLETVAAAVVVSVAWNLEDRRLRATLLQAFGVGWLAWVGYTLSPDWTSWGLYQGVRAVSLLLFCWASLQPRPMLRVIA